MALVPRYNAVAILVYIFKERLTVPLSPLTLSPLRSYDGTKKRLAPVSAHEGWRLDIRIYGHVMDSLVKYHASRRF